MNILLVNVGDERIISNNPPLGLAYIAGYIKRYTEDTVKVIDLAVENLESDFIENFHPDLVGISTLTPTYSKAERVAKKIKEVSSAHICIGGYHVSAFPNDSIDKEWFDSVVVGQGEKCFLEIRNDLLNGVKNIGVRVSENIDNLDDLPFPNREIFPLDKYNFRIKGNEAVNILSSRGCRFKCIYCDKSVFGIGIKRRSVRNIIDEIDYVIEKFGIRGFYFVDDAFTFDNPTVYEFCKLIKDRNIVWRCMTRADRVTETLIARMKEAGCYEISIGVESGDKEILKKIRKGVTKEQISKCFRLLKKHKIRNKGFFIIGFPWETEESIDKTIEFAKELDPDRVQFSVAVPFPGTELRKELHKLNIPVSSNWEDYEFTNNKDINPIYDGLFLSKKQISEKVQEAKEIFNGKE